jgi:hypothetical protein
MRRAAGIDQDKLAVEDHRLRDCSSSKCGWSMRSLRSKTRNLDRPELMRIEASVPRSSQCEILDSVDDQCDRSIARVNNDNLILGHEETVVPQLRDSMQEKAWKLVQLHVARKFSPKRHPQP